MCLNVDVDQRFPAAYAFYAGGGSRHSVNLTGAIAFASTFNGTPTRRDPHLRHRQARRRGDTPDIRRRGIQSRTFSRLFADARSEARHSSAEPKGASAGSDDERGDALQV